MNSYYLAVNLIRDILMNNPDVNTIVHGKTEDMDIYKKSIYPLAHMTPISAPFDSSQVNAFIFQIAVLNQRMLSTNNLVEDKFFGNDNEVDNFNLCHAVLNDLISTLRNQNNDIYLELVDVSEATPIFFSDFNLLDGWAVNIRVELPNTVISVCD